MLRFGALFSVAAMACSSGPSIASSELDQALHQARCERLARCGLFPDEASCLAYFRVIPDVSVAAAITAHKVTYDGERAKQCVDAIAKQSCDVTAHDSRTLAVVCEAMYTGAVAGGEPCAINTECASGTCTLPTDCPESGCCAGTCRPAQAPGKAGTACARTRDCAADLVCATDRTCHALAKAGEPCGSDRECGDGLGCINPLSTMPGTCRALPHAGEPCPYLRCADENVQCDEAKTHTCVALGLPQAPCATAADCSPYMECDATTLKCRELPSLGMPCTTACQGESYCLLGASGGTCSTPQANGALCESRNDCASNYCFVGPVFDNCTDAPACI
jgi:hypothetical protein